MSKETVKLNNNKKFRRLYFDLETSPNIVFSWNIGYNISLDYNNIIKERAIICACYKWEDEKDVKYLAWDNGDDKSLCTKLADIINSADEVVAHNGDKYDIRWIRTRCFYHGISLTPYITSIDTLKLSRSGFRFNSNRLDYISKFIGLKGKMETGGFDLWKDVVLHNKKTSLKKMIDYCKQDVLLLEKVYQKLSPFVKHKTHKAILSGGLKRQCPECKSNNCHINKRTVSASGVIKVDLKCVDCGKYHRVSLKDLE